jgi:adenosylcobinamide kinase/adenosylcobinamide-phosphate guanylyltransferase
LKSMLITGGARSGKSCLAQELAVKYGRPVLFVATAEAGDDEMKRRIKIHRMHRPADWKTLEVTTHVGDYIKKNIGEAKTVIIDDITLLVSNIFMQYDEKTNPEQVEKAVEAEIRELLDCVANVKAEFIIVTNEVGLGIIPADRITRLYRDTLGRANQTLAEYADEVYFMVSGIPMVVKKA